jgi:hypothetical protein
LRKQFVVGFGRELEATVVKLEVVVVAGNEVYGALALDLLVECSVSDAVDGRCIAKFFVERRLIIESRGKAHSDILVPRWDDAE